MIAIVKRAQEYRLLHQYLADPWPSDAWEEEGVAFVVFDLLPAYGKGANDDHPPCALFVIRREQQRVVEVKTVIPNSEGTEAEIRDLRRPGQSYRWPLPLGWAGTSTTRRPEGHLKVKSRVQIAAGGRK